MDDTSTAACASLSCLTLTQPSRGESTCGHNALHLAAANGRTHVCRYLVQDLGFPVDGRSSSGDTPLILAALSGHTATAAYLLERGADPRAPDSDGDTPLRWTAYNGDRELAMLLLHRGADVGAANPRGTALHVAASRAHPEVVAVLLRHGADVYMSGRPVHPEVEREHGRAGGLRRRHTAGGDSARPLATARDGGRRGGAAPLQL